MRRAISIVLDEDMLDLQCRQLGASAESVISDADESGIAKAGECARTSCNDLCSDRVGEATDLLGSARSLSSRTPHGKAHDVRVRWRWQVLEAMYERDRAQSTFDGR